MIGTTLYVADEVDNCIRIYDTGGGKYLGVISDPSGLVSSPTHLLAQNCMLYIGVSPSAGNQNAAVLCFNPSQQSLFAVISNSDKLNVRHPAGMTFDGSGNFYLADLKAQVVYQFDSQFTPAATQPFIPQGGGTMPDSPEFILWVNDEWVEGRI